MCWPPHLDHRRRKIHGEHYWQQIELEFLAAERGLTGLAYGTAQHQFITAKLERIGKLHEQLVTVVGGQQAIKIFTETLEQAGNEAEVSRH